MRSTSRMVWCMVGCTLHKSACDRLALTGTFMFAASVSVGPRAALDLSIPGLGERGSFNLGARFDLPRIEFDAGQAYGTFVYFAASFQSSLVFYTDSLQA